MNTVPIVPENVASRMPAQPASAPMSAHKPSVTEQVAVRGLTYTVRRWGPADAPQVGVAWRGPLAAPRLVHGLHAGLVRGAFHPHRRIGGVPEPSLDGHVSCGEEHLEAMRFV